MEDLLNKTYSVEDVETIALELKKLLPRCKIMTFQGSLGAGKTTLVRALLKACGVKETITSPTFTYVNCYQNDKGEFFNHFDCYRLDTAQAFIDQGFDEYLYAPDSWTFVEWPEVIEPLLKTGVCRVVLDYEGPHSRSIKVSLK